jgi:carbon-monoxide dehydrogenase large subunit
MMAARALRAQMRSLAAYLLEVDPSEIRDTESGFATDAGAQLSVARVADAAWRATDLPPGTQPGLEAGYTYDPQNFAFSFGAVAAVVEIDPGTGTVSVRRLVFGHDCGVQLNPALVEGQIQGSTAQGIGAALYEELPYTADGQPVVQSMWDYSPPLPANVPPIESIHLETPSPFSLNGAKGAGESGVIPLPAVLANAIRDALGDNHARVVDTLPITAERLLRAVTANADPAPQPAATQGGTAF